MNSIYTWIEYSHKIVGWSVGPALETTYPLEVLRMALPTIDDTSSGMLIQHSDRGCQYGSNEYVAELKKRGVTWGMTVGSVGHQRIGQHESYPPLKHNIEYMFNPEIGRVLTEYQMLYIFEGGGVAFILSG